VLSVDNHRQIFEIGSITKVFTSTLLAEMVIENKINLGEDINNYISLLLKNNTRITFQQLANHTSGLPRLPSNLIIADMTNPYKDYDEEKLKEYLTEKLTLVQNQPAKYEYSNLGAGLLGYVLSKIETTNYESLLKDKIFAKYQMSNSTTNRENVKELLIKGLNTAGNETSNWDLSVLIGAGGILSCTDDLAKFAIAQFDDSNKALALTRTKTFDINKNMGIGLGWHIIKTQSGDEWTWHNGGTGGYSSSLAIDMKKKTGVIVLSNVSAFHKNMGNIDNLCFELMNMLGN
jgi:CubicO group peptidase (beta-lactamase class C family)